MASIATQPQPAKSAQMDLYRDYHNHNCNCEKGEHLHSHGECNSHPAGHKTCHNSRLRHFLLPAIVSLILFGALLAFSCIGEHTYDLFGMGSEGLARRATTDASGNTNGTFVHNKLYLIVIFVGLLVVVILAVMLSAWCCRGAFENPLCCPCYLCACCGGLACLECIGCGLCAEGVDQM